jgi:TRAP-type C4-dicarboxylate transport system permease large subunit
MGDAVAALVPSVVVAVAFVAIIVAIIRNQGVASEQRMQRARTVMASSRSAISPLAWLALSPEIRFPNDTNPVCFTPEVGE